MIREALFYKSKALFYKSKGLLCNSKGQLYNSKGKCLYFFSGLIIETVI